MSVRVYRLRVAGRSGTCGGAARGLPAGLALPRDETPMTSLLQILLLVLDLVWWVVIAHVIMSWLIGFNVLNRNQPLVWQVWTGLERLLEPIYRPIRNLMPNLGGLDLAPLIVLVALYALRIVLMNNASLFM
jgi:YggT family protein